MDRADRAKNAPKPDAAKVAAAVESAKTGAALRGAAPSYADHVSAFGPQGLKVSAEGVPVGYDYPKPKDETERRSINAKVQEMWRPHQRKEVEIGSERNAKIPTARVRNLRTGRIEELPVQSAVSKMRKGAAVEAPMRIGGNGVITYRDGRYWRRTAQGLVPCEPPPSRFHEIVESGKAPAGFVH